MVISVGEGMKDGLLHPAGEHGNQFITAYKNHNCVCPLKNQVCMKLTM